MPKFEDAAETAALEAAKQRTTANAFALASASNRGKPEDKLVTAMIELRKKITPARVFKL